MALLGESPRQRVEMAFELARIDPTSVPINLLNPRTGTKFGDRELMDPWEVVKWIAIFRLILPDALFRLCGGRVENLHELQPLAVKAGLSRDGWRSAELSVFETASFAETLY